MATVPTTHTFVTGEVVSASTLNGSLGATTGPFFLTPPLAILRQTVAQSIPNGLGTWTDVTFDTEDTDNDNGHSTVTNTARYTAQTPGTFAFGPNLAWSNGTTGGRLGRLALNGTAVNGTNAEVTNAFSAAFGMPVALTLIPMNGTTDYVTLQASQNSGAALNTAVTADTMSRMNVWRVSG